MSDKALKDLLAKMDQMPDIKTDAGAIADALLAMGKVTPVLCIKSGRGSDNKDLSNDPFVQKIIERMGEKAPGVNVICLQEDAPGYQAQLSSALAAKEKTLVIVDAHAPQKSLMERVFAGETVMIIEDSDTLLESHPTAQQRAAARDLSLPKLKR